MVWGQATSNFPGILPSGSFTSGDLMCASNAGGSGAADCGVYSNSSNLKVANNKVYAWSSTAASNGTADTQLSRPSAGVISADTGTAGNAAATLDVATVTAGTAITTPSIAVNSDTAFTASPRLTFSAFGATVGAAAVGWAGFNPDKPITITRVTAVMIQAPVGCSTTPNFGVTDGTAVAASTNSATGADSGAISVAKAAGSEIYIGVANVDVGCGTQPNNVNIVVEYKMQ
jgi:hypothetical protein